MNENKKKEESPAIQLLTMVWENEGYGWGRSWARLNSIMRDALLLAIDSGLCFFPDDFKTIVNGFSFSFWCGEGGLEHYYKIACNSGPGDRGNTSACQAIEKHIDRPPFILKRVDDQKGRRLAIGSQFWWDNRWLTITSFKDKDSFIACSYKENSKDLYFYLNGNNYRVDDFNENGTMKVSRVDREAINRARIDKRLVITRAQIEERNKSVMAELKKRKEEAKKKKEEEVEKEKE